MDREITLRSIGASLWRGRWIILITAVVAGVIGLLLTFVTTTTYTATGKVALGQATTTSGIPVSTPATNPLTAATVLRSDRIVAKVAAAAGVKPGRVRDDATITVPRAPGASAGSQQAVATITVTDSDRAVARRISNAYVEVAFAEANTGYQGLQRLYRQRLVRLQADQARYLRQVDVYSAQLVRAAGTAQETAYQSLLFAAQNQLASVRDSISSQEVTIAKSAQIEAPEIIEVPGEPSSSTSAPNRVRTVVIAVLLGLLLGIVIALVWGGGSARRAASTA